MKKEIENREDLLRSLAVKGDSHAFFSLSAPYFKARYLRERSTGASHQEAQTRVLAEASELLEKLQHVNPARIDAWFEEHCMIIASSESDTVQQETSPDRKLLAETASFLNRCSRDLLCSNSKMKRERRLNNRRFPKILFGNPIVRSLLLVALAIGFCLASVLLMTLFHTSVHVTFETPGHQFSLRIPMSIADSTGTNDTTPAPIGTDSAIVKNEPERNQPPNPAPVQETNTDDPRFRTDPIPAPPQTPPPVAKARPLPPVVPKARMVLPPMPPPQSVEPGAIPATSVVDEPLQPQTTPAPSQPPTVPPGAPPGN